MLDQLINHEQEQFRCGPGRDPYDWIKPGNWRNVVKNHKTPDAKILSFLKNMNREIALFLDGTAELRAAIEKEIRERKKIGRTEILYQDSLSTYVLNKNRESSYPVLYRVDADGVAGTVLSFPDLAKKYKYYKLEKVRITADGRYLVFSYDCRANESFRIAVWDLHTGEEAEHFTGGTTGDFILHPESIGFYYLVLNRNHRPTRLYFHQIGCVEDEDELIYREKENRNFLKIKNPDDGEHLVIKSDNEKSVMIKLLSMKTGKIRHFKSHREGEIIRDVCFHEGYLYFRTNIDGRADFAIFRTPWPQLRRKYWEEVVGCIKGSILIDYIIEDDLIILIRQNSYGCSLYHFSIENRQEVRIELRNRPFCDMEFKDDERLEDKILYIMTPVDPPEVFMHRQHLDQEAEDGIYFRKDSTGYRIQRLFFDAHDGTSIPVTVLYGKDARLDGTAPLFVTAYGAYGLYHDMDYKPELLSLIDRGYIYAVIHARGGTEKGHEWHLKGRMFQKKNTCTDFLEGVEFLIANRYASKGNIVAYGYSAGGIVAGYAANNRPDLFRLIIADMPFVDVLNTMQDKSLPLTPMEWAEWGNPIKSRKAFNYIKSYCPYQNVRQQDYPWIIALGGLYDPRVMFWEPAKWVALLRDYNTAADTRQFLYTNMEVGHWGYYSSGKSARETAKLYALILRIMGHTGS